MSDRNNPSLLARILKSVAGVEPHEVSAVLLSMVYFFFLFGSYSVVKPVRDAMGTVYGIKHLNELFIGTFIGTLILAPLYAGLASRIKLSNFLPWVYGFIALTILGFYALFSGGKVSDRYVAAGFYIWVSVFNMLIISVFWSFMADIFSRTQAKRLFGFIAAGGTVGGIAGPAIATFLAKGVGNDGLMLISAAGFVVTGVLVKLLAGARDRLVAASGNEGQRTNINHRLGGRNPLDGFILLLKSPYLLLIAGFLFLMTFISTIVYTQLGDLITKAFTDHNARTQAYATIELAVNSLAVVIQLIGTGRIIQRFGVTLGLMLNPVIMVFAFLAIAFSPVLMILGGLQVVRRVAEYAVAKPTREMLFTVVDQESKYKAKNVIDTVVYRGGDMLAAQATVGVLNGFGDVGLAILGIIVSLIWFPMAWILGRRYESARSTDGLKTAAVPAAGH
ncbi:MAG TPA: Npt1/Npt2 family nucleotide transporter [Steroidobacteraceae bacterium]|nr:Npt1/Npt2 family nucleotide transporter [Steroidobacteraceae bacterium]